MEEYTREIRTQPLLLASLLGATALQPKLIEALHDAAIAACGAKRTKYLSSTYDMRILPAKRGGRDSPGYRVEGIIKRRWLEKLCNGIPAVLVLCIDWSEDLRQPEQEESQVLHYLQHARRQAKERDLRLLIFIILHESTADPEASCGFLRNQPEFAGLVVAVGTPDLPMKAPKLERLIYQSAMSFYADEEKRLRKPWAPKAPVPTSAHTAMQVRMFFKVAFLNEFRKDVRAALTAYIKAYELLLNNTDVADPIERMDLCNHITVRMYERYFASHDVGAAVHHCRIHTSSLRTCCSDDDELVWRKWRWLSLNHVVFGDFLDTMSQKAPMLIDQNDLWQFPGFHYQVAASYARRLREWALRCLEPGHLASSSEQGGELRPSPFLGQAGVLERPSEVEAPGREVALRLAHAEAKLCTDHADRSLKLLIRAQAAAKERGYAAWTTSSQARVAEAYLCEPGTGHQEAARNLFERLNTQNRQMVSGQMVSGQVPTPSWPSLRRFSLERSLLCCATALGMKVPELCSSSRAVPASSLLDAGADSSPAQDLSILRRSLVQDAFEYLKLPDSAVSSDFSQAEELVALVASAATQEEAGSIEIPLSRCQLSWSEAAEDSDMFHVEFGKLDLPASLELASCFARTTTGDVPLSIEAGEGQTWQVGCVLRLRGSLPGTGAAVTTVCLTWAKSPSVVFLGACELKPCPSARDCISDAGIHSGFPTFHLADGTSSATQVSQEGLRKPSDLRLKLQAEAVLPVEPVAGLVSECFLFYVVVYAWPERPPMGSCQVSLACHVRFSDDLDENAPHLAEKPTGVRVDLLKVSDKQVWDLESLGTSGSKIHVADFTSELKARAGLLSLEPGDLKGAPLRLRHEASKGVSCLALPLAVRCGHACSVSLGLEIQQVGGDAEAQCWTPQIRFKHALKLHTAEERLSAAMLAQKPVSFSLRCHLATAVDIVKAEVFFTPEGSDTERAVSCLGKMGQMQPGSSYAFLWPLEPGLVLKSRPRLRVFFHRYQAVQAFFPWKEASSNWPPNPLPAAVVEWLLPAPTSAAASSQSMQVELQVSSTGTVGTPLVVQVCLRYARTVDHDEIKVRVLQGEGEVPDRYLLSGPTCYQAACLATADPNDVIPSFSLIPLKTGWLSLPRVQVTWGSQDATSTPSSAFIMPSCQPALTRSLA